MTVPRFPPTLSRAAVSRNIRTALSWVPPANFITVHYLYFILTSLIFAIVFWGSATPGRNVTFVDSLFLTVSAMTLAGLNTVNLSTLNTFQQILLFLLIMLGSAILVSAAVVHVRKKAFEMRFKEVVERARAERRRRRRHSKSDVFLSRANSSERRDSETEVQAGAASAQYNLTSTQTVAEEVEERTHQNKAQAINGEVNRVTIPKAYPPATRKKANGLPGIVIDPLARNTDNRDDVPASAALQRFGPTYHIAFSPDAAVPARHPIAHPRRRRTPRLFSFQGVGARPDATLGKVSRRGSGDIEIEDLPRLDGRRSHHLFPPVDFISHNSQFSGLDHVERERLGGVEYKCIEFLSFLVPLYFVLWQLLGCVGLGAYVANNRAETARANGLNPWWVGAFNGVSAFNNSGMSLLDANMVAFQTSVYMLVTMGLLILAGNTCFPIFLRLIVWTLRQVTPKSDGWEDIRVTLKFLLDHPRRCYTHLFPPQHTWWLLFAVISLNAVDWAAYEILNIGNTAITSAPVGIRVIDGLFQAFAVRNGGFYVVAISSLRVSLQFLYVVMMYISVYPVALSMRTSNVYEERSLGMYGEDPDADDRDEKHSALFRTLKRQLTASGQHETRGYFVRQQIRAQLSHDAWWICLAIFIILIIENAQFDSNPDVFSVFNVMFEVVSAYGTVGISVGLPNAAYSFCGAWHALSKLVLCAVMLRGRHRGLPVAIDRAVLLPGEHLHEAEEEDARIRTSRSFTAGHAV